MRVLAALACLLPGLALGAFPQLVDSTSGELGFSDSAAVPMPSVGPNDLLVLCISLDGDDTINVSGWTRLWEDVTAGATASATCFAKDADGTEDEGLVTVTWTDTENGSYIAASFSGTFDGSPSSISCTAAVGGVSATHDPPSHNPAGWDVEDTTWLATTAYGFTPAVTAFPYASNNISVTHSGAGGAGQGWATTQSAAASEDPGTFTIDGTQEHVVSTCGIRPQAAGGGFWFWE